MKGKIILLWLVILSSAVFSQTEDQIVYQLFRSSNTATDLCSQTINYAAEAIFGTKDLTGNFKSEGTLTQISLSPVQWKYDATPTGKLVVKFLDGTSIEIIYTAASGYDKGSYSDFVSSHTTFAFSMKIADILDLSIQSQALYTGNQGDNTINFSRTITGSYNFSGTWVTVNITNKGTTHTVLDGGTYLEYSTNETATGTSSTVSSNTQVNDNYYSMIINSRISSPATYVSNKILTNNSSVTIGNHSYAFQNAVVKWAAGTQFPDSANAGIYNKAIDLNYWLTQGTLLKDNQIYGNIVFDNPVILQSYGPKAVALLANNKMLLIHPILQSWVRITDVEKDNKEPLLNTNYSLLQNYPNPFNPSTIISWRLTVRSHVTLKVYDVLGNEAATLVNEDQPAGNYEVEFDASKLSSGIYFYEINAGTFRSIKKMILLR